MADAEIWVWWKTGDCRNEASELVGKFLHETGQKAPDKTVNLQRMTTPKGEQLTFFSASGQWWTEQMKVHPNGWRGARMLDLIQHFDL